MIDYWCGHCRKMVVTTKFLDKCKCGRVFVVNPDEGVIRHIEEFEKEIKHKPEGGE